MPKLSTQEHLMPIDPARGWRVFNLGGTVLVSAEFEGDGDAMPASWVCPLNSDPFRMTAVVDGPHYTRRLIDASGRFALAVATVSNAEETYRLGCVSKCDEPQKLGESGADFFTLPEFGDIPLVDGCVAYGLFRALPADAMAEDYDLFLGECEALWVDERLVNEAGDVDFDRAPEELTTIHYLGAGDFRVLGKGLKLD